jgi:2-methylcitrate dehydratase PrpD
MVQQATQLVSHQQAETRSAVERIGAFAAAARAQQLKPNVRQLFKRNILDSLACAIAALPGRPFQALREQFEEYQTLSPFGLMITVDRCARSFALTALRNSQP